MMPMFKFGPDGMPIMDEPMQIPQMQQQQELPPPPPQPAAFIDHTHQQPQPQQHQQQQQQQNENQAEIELVQKWSQLILPYKNNMNKLEAEAQFPCDFGDDDQQQYNNYNNPYNHMYRQMDSSPRMHEKCGCVERISVLMDYYMNWMSTKQEKGKAMGMSYLISILSDYSMSALYNDFFHLKRFHAEDVADKYSIEPLTTYFAKNFGGYSIEESVCLSRNNRNFAKCKDSKILRAWYYIDKNEDAEIIGTNLECEEIATQQILDMIHCFIYHVNDFSYNDTTTPLQLEQIRKVYAMRKQKFESNRYLTNIHPYHHIPYKPMDMETPKGFDDDNPLLSGSGYYAQNNGYHQITVVQ